MFSCLLRIPLIPDLHTQFLSIPQRQCVGFLLCGAGFDPLRREPPLILIRGHCRSSQAASSSHSWALTVSWSPSPHCVLLPAGPLPCVASDSLSPAHGICLRQPRQQTDLFIHPTQHWPCPRTCVQFPCWPCLATPHYRH